MVIDEKMVEYVAKLSRIQLDSEQAAAMQSELGKILEYMEVLKTVDTESVEPMAYAFSLTNVVRHDVVSGHFDRDLLLENAPERTDEAFVVPKVVEA
ncbi:MAG: Asp-tRNA(Asn)/Glu-tRNA(Gln) amidotransferase subunit GatC [Defluviitaleaceae bacterium]|nr:Asp-tRNA(Asn)/Glu-tRNA(Gln) amidotransferase subunit GatC [Defluviitaleaceae bacterium]